MKASQLLIMLLLAANLAATIWFGLDKQTDYQENPTKQTAVHQLPDALNATIRNKMYSDFANAFNAKDYDALLTFFAPSTCGSLRTALR